MITKIQFPKMLLGMSYIAVGVSQSLLKTISCPLIISISHVLFTSNNNVCPWTYAQGGFAGILGNVG